MKLKRYLAVLLLLFVFAASASASDIYDSEPTFSPYYAGTVKSSVLYDALDELNHIRKDLSRLGSLGQHDPEL